MASKKGSYIATGDNATERRRSLSVPVLPANFSKVAPSKEFEAEEIRERERGWEGFEERIHSADSREYIVRSSEGTCGVMDFLVSLLLAFLIRLYVSYRNDHCVDFEG
ncbi:hypothetical protein HK104_003633 [Borealophlyctis nickersoniae]|nr:hypothetical protein HK104_003633 [Borealophlyctis nickersoniae]